MIHLREQKWNEAILTTKVESPVFRIWHYASPAVVLGCSQKKLLNSIRAKRSSDIDLIIRRSGGGAVLLGPWLIALSVALPHEHPLVTKAPIGSYEWLAKCYQEVLFDFGVDNQLIQPGQVKETIKKYQFTGLDWACFAGISPWEVLSRAGKKIVGLAQVRQQTGVLLVSGMLVSRPNWCLLCETLGKTDADALKLRSLTSSCEDELGAIIERNRIGEALERSISKSLHG